MLMALERSLYTAVVYMRVPSFYPCQPSFILALHGKATHLHIGMQMCAPNDLRLGPKHPVMVFYLG